MEPLKNVSNEMVIKIITTTSNKDSNKELSTPGNQVKLWYFSQCLL